MQTFCTFRTAIVFESRWLWTSCTAYRERWAGNAPRSHLICRGQHVASGGTRACIRSWSKIANSRYDIGNSVYLAILYPRSKSRRIDTFTPFAQSPRALYISFEILNTASNMTTDANELVTDSALLEVVEAAIQARQQCLQIIDELGLLSAQSGANGEDFEAVQFRMRKQMNARLAKLRGLNRKAVLSVRSTKQETTEARQEIDSLHLQLQNLYYEQRHLRGEISACEDYE